MWDLPLQGTWSLQFSPSDWMLFMWQNIFWLCEGNKREAHSEQKEIWDIREVHLGSSCSLLVKFKTWRNGRRDDEMSVTVLLLFGCILGPLFTRTAVTLPAINGHSHDQRDLICPLERERGRECKLQSLMRPLILIPAAHTLYICQVTQRDAFCETMKLPLQV